MTDTRALASSVLSAALDYCYRHRDLADWAPDEYLSLLSDDMNLVDMEIAGMLS